MGCNASSTLKTDGSDFVCDPRAIDAEWKDLNPSTDASSALSAIFSHFLEGGSIENLPLPAGSVDEPQHAALVLRSRAALDVVLIITGRRLLPHLMTPSDARARDFSKDDELDHAFLRLLLRCARAEKEQGPKILAAHRFLCLDVVLLVLLHMQIRQEGAGITDKYQEDVKDGTEHTHAADPLAADARELLALVSGFDPSAVSLAWTHAVLAAGLWACMTSRDLSDTGIVCEVDSHSIWALAASLGLSDTHTAVVESLLSSSREGDGDGPAAADRGQEGPATNPYELGSRPLQRAYAAHTRVLVRCVMCTWQLTACHEFPAQMMRRSREEQKEVYRRCQRILVKSKTSERRLHRRYGAEPNERWHSPQAVALLEEVRATNRKGAALVHNSGEDEDVFEVLQGYRLFEATRHFCRRAEECGLPKPEIFQAGRNCWTCYAFQVIYGSSDAVCQDAIYGYSMLYPYTDNFLDDTTIPLSQKLAFQYAFDQRLQGVLTAGCEQEKLESDEPFKTHHRCVKAFEMVTMIEQQWDRREHPDAYLALAAINNAQTWSLRQDLDTEDVYQSHQRLLEQTCFKGGTSVLADAHMVYGALGVPQATFAFALGVGLQIVDDLQDTKSDIRNAQHTLFTIAHMRKCRRYGREGAIKLCSFLDKICMSAPTWDDKVCAPDASAEDVMIDTSLTAAAKTILRPNRAPQIDSRLRALMLNMTWNMVFKAIARNPLLFDVNSSWLSSLFFMRQDLPDGTGDAKQTPFVRQWGPLGPLPPENMHQIASMRTLHRMACNQII